MDTIIGGPMKEKEKKRRYRGRNRSAIGRTALAVGILNLAILVVLIVIARRGVSEDSQRVAALGVLDFFLAIGGMAISAKGMRESNVFYYSALAGAILNTVIFILLLGLYLIGMVLG